VKRRLSAIIAADVVNYTRLLSDDEAGMLAALNTMRLELFEPIVRGHEGIVIKRMGDGWLVEFSNGTSAVHCALDLQQQLVNHPLIRIRIGVHIGNVTFQEDDIYGDGINIAARLESLAEPGQVLVSDTVFHSLDGKAAANFSGGDTRQLKNVSRLIPTWFWPPHTALKGRSNQNAPKDKTENQIKPSIAVLPFDNMSQDPEQEYFSDGISEDIITDLSKVSGLTVIARNSSFAFKGKSHDLREVGQQLGVKTVLEGSVRKAGSRVRITAQLIDAQTGSHLWAERYDRELTDVFEVQDEVTLKIVNALKINLTTSERANISESGSNNIEAHEHYMRIRSCVLHPDLNASLWQHAIDQGERAIALDPEFADAYAGLGIMHIYDFHNGWSGNPPEVALRKAEALTYQALKLDPDGIQSNHSLAIVTRWQGDYELAATAIEKTLRRSPEAAAGLFTRGEILMATGQLEKAIDDFKHSMRLDPEFSHQYLQYLGMCQFLLGDYEKAVAAFRERVTLSQNTDLGRAWLASALGHLGEIKEAQAIWADLMRLNPNFSFEKRLARQEFRDSTYSQLVMKGLEKAQLLCG
jgi:adenylate cyclase